MNPRVRALAQAFAATTAGVEPIVEIGSRHADGQSVVAELRSFFPGKEYLGCDIQDGPGVDRIEDITRMSFADESVGTLICCETVEHVFQIAAAFREMHRVLKPGGSVLLTTPMSIGIHAHPSDFWRMTPMSLREMFKAYPANLVGGVGRYEFPETVFGIASKGDDADFAASHQAFREKVVTLLGELRAARPFKARAKQLRRSMWANIYKPGGDYIRRKHEFDVSWWYHNDKALNA